MSTSCGDEISSRGELAPAAKVELYAGGLLSTMIGLSLESAYLDEAGMLTGLVLRIFGVVAERGRGIFDFGWGEMDISTFPTFLTKWFCHQLRFPSSSQFTIFQD
jgi:hypothetical protein